MVWLIRRRNDVRPICPMKGCFCLDNRMGCFISTIFTALSVLFALIFVILDLISWGVPEFQVDHRFPTYWRIRFWKGSLHSGTPNNLKGLFFVISSWCSRI
ncbi:hypothetical protein X801_06187 [Opisthorchis viverrini]|uniref:Uncharacterized protein n=2 Tax=Opisthorchis viverrini TaxID=6198 RepID=A0A1S8WUE9_OPIVI|nr:hypothetical protein T265_03514 [Opisthorchis viverrini]KER29922.1 hypothetical protein T265_03514 [Opisthorchis viverrini]OON17965.1 hypothetical protein X801_06187 [Opisthorchis viverrini]